MTTPSPWCRICGAAATTKPRPQHDLPVLSCKGSSGGRGKTGGHAGNWDIHHQVKCPVPRQHGLQGHQDSCEQRRMRVTWVHDRVEATGVSLPGSDSPLESSPYELDRACGPVGGQCPFSPGASGCVEGYYYYSIGPPGFGSQDTGAWVSALPFGFRYLFPRMD